MGIFKKDKELTSKQLTKNSIFLLHFFHYQLFYLIAPAGCFHVYFFSCFPLILIASFIETEQPITNKNNKNFQLFSYYFFYIFISMIVIAVQQET